MLINDFANVFKASLDRDSDASVGIFARLYNPNILLVLDLFKTFQSRLEVLDSRLDLEALVLELISSAVQASLKFDELLYKVFS